MVIFNREVANEYQYLISEVINISINQTKSVIGDSRSSQIEFTKRLALDGKEMSSIKMNILNKSNKQSLLDLVDILIERDFISPDTHCYSVYPFLNHEEQIRLNFMFWVRSGLETPFKGITSTCSIDRDSFNKHLKDKRSQNLMEKTALIDEYLLKAKPLDEYYQQRSQPYNRKVLGLESHPNDNLMLHPLVWAINQTGLDLSIALSSIWDDEAQIESPVEYLPIVSSESYFFSPRK